MRPSHRRNAGDAGHEAFLDERIDRRRKPALAPGELHVGCSDVETLRDWDDDVVFRDVGLLGEESPRHVVIKAAGRVITFLGTHELGRFERET